MLLDIKGYPFTRQRKAFIVFFSFIFHQRLIIIFSECQILSLTEGHTCFAALCFRFFLKY